jgi:hypothetical protein
MKEGAIFENLSQIILMCPNVFRLVESPEFRMCFESSGSSAGETLSQNIPESCRELSVA